MRNKSLDIAVITVLTVAGITAGSMMYNNQSWFSADSPQILVAVDTPAYDTNEYEVLIHATSTIWQEWFPVTIPMKIGSVEVMASVASTVTERTLGLSGTPYLPAVVVKLFIFEDSARHAFWMKDMKYPIDIIWVNEELRVVHIEREVSPDSYPVTFAPDSPARYVIETVAGFADEHRLEVGTEIVLPSGW